MPKYGTQYMPKHMPAYAEKCANICQKYAAIFRKYAVICQHIFWFIFWQIPEIFVLCCVAYFRFLKLRF